MANDLNQCNFIGRLGKDPEVRYTQGGNAVASFSIACGWKSKDKEGTEWVSVTAFGKLGEICGEYLAKGKQVFVSGRFTTDKYEKDGVTRYSTRIVADTVQFLGSRDEGNTSSSGPRGGAPARQRPARATDAAGEGFADDDLDGIPF